ncbi:MAG TPA: DUF1838 family protein [Steroidobacteraceae bacterium]|nr:DUF1838 family protein [Steroidobacteraceae bacterium]HRX88835.1 DUF1838 family protein [Steroidobacteraceae bacterium]
MNRRDAMHSLLGASLTAGSSWASSAAHRTARSVTIPTNDPAFALRTIGRLQGDLSGQTTYTYNAGFVYGIVPDSSLAPGEFGRLLYQVEGCTKRRSRALSDGSIEDSSRSWMVYRSAATGAYLDSYVNPYTDKEIAVPRVRGGPAKLRLTVHGPVVPNAARIESTAFGAPLRLHWRDDGQRVWISRHTASAIRSSEGGIRQEFSIDAWVCARDELLDPRATHLPSTYTWTSHTNWQNWLQMKDHPGYSLWQIDAQVLPDKQNLPDRLLRRLEAVAPGEIDQPLE